MWVTPIIHCHTLDSNAEQILTIFIQFLTASGHFY